MNPLNRKQTEKELEEIRDHLKYNLDAEDIVSLFAVHIYRASKENQKDSMKVIDKVIKNLKGKVQYLPKKQ